MNELTAQYPGFAGKVAVVTGAARGIGARFVAGLVEQGVRVVAADLDEIGVQSLERSLKPNAGLIAISMDVTSPEDHERLAQAAIAEFGQVDFWINNAGIFPQASVLDVPADQISDTLGVNVSGVLFGAQAAARAMGSRGGAIVNMSSVAAYRVRPTRSVYATSKAAVDHLTRALALELGPLGIRVNAVAPGFIDTNMTAWLHETPGLYEKTISGVPLQRIGTTEDVLNAALFLLSASASYVSGCTLVVDGAARWAST